MPNVFNKDYDFYVGTNSTSDIVAEGSLIIDTPGGASAGTLPASLFGLNIITRPVYFTDSANVNSFIGVPAFNGASVLVKNASASTHINLPNGTYYAVVQGR